MRSRASSLRCARSATCDFTRLRLPSCWRSALVLGVDRMEMIALLFAITFVLVTELVNTALEAAVDSATDHFDPAGQDGERRSCRCRPHRLSQRGRCGLPRLLRQADVCGRERPRDRPPYRATDDDHRAGSDGARRSGAQGCDSTRAPSSRADGHRATRRSRSRLPRRSPTPRTRPRWRSWRSSSPHSWPRVGSKATRTRFPRSSSARCWDSSSRRSSFKYRWSERTHLE